MAPTTCSFSQGVAPTAGTWGEQVRDKWGDPPPPRELQRGAHYRHSPPTIIVPQDILKEVSPAPGGQEPGSFQPTSKLPGAFKALRKKSVGVDCLIDRIVMIFILSNEIVTKSYMKITCSQCDRFPEK